MKKLKFVSHSETQTQKLARKLAGGLKKDDCLALEGDFGSGKTTFVRGLVEGLKSRKKHYVCSPSFVILKTYNGRIPVYHFDLYRLRGMREFLDIGFNEFVSCGGISVIEWADKIRPLLPEGALKIKFTILGPRRRRLSFFAPGCPRLQKLLGRVLRSIKSHE